MVVEVERWPHTPNAVGKKNRETVDCIHADNSKEVLICDIKGW